MSEQIGEGYYLVSGHRRAPGRLVSEPPDYPSCIETLRRARLSDRSAPQLKAMCERLYRLERKEALGFLVSAYWAADFAARHGLTISAGQVERGLQQYAAQQYPRKSEYLPDIAQRGRTLAQERFIMKNDLVTRYLLQKVLAAGPTGQLHTEVLQDAETAICPAEDIVEHCRGYKDAPQPRETGPSVAVMLEEIAHSPTAALMSTSH